MRLFFVVGLWLGAVMGSYGDRMPLFKSCVDQCVEETCPRALSADLRLLLWTCEADCDYQCQQNITAAYRSTLGEVYQYHGKWPFIRVLGVQEPASVIFSILNFVPNYLGYRALARTRDSRNWGMKAYYRFFAIVSMNAWLWSSVFHTRDFVLTERLDYFSAVGSIMYGFALAIVRLFRLDLASRVAVRCWVLGAVALFYVLHVSYLSFWNFDYAYNMAVGVAVGVLQNLLWIVLSIQLYRRTQVLYNLLPAGLVVLVMLGMCFELFDFPPLGLAIDAHSLWHAATVLPTYFWYKWMLYDMRQGPRTDEKRNV